jgi:hypothetical protein
LDDGKLGNPERVTQEKQVIGLGVALDYRMTMNDHLEHIMLTALTGVAVLKNGDAQNITQASLYKLMKATVCSRADYGLHMNWRIKPCARSLVQ